MKKVLFVANKLYGGGAEKVITLLANELSNRNNIVEIVAYNKLEDTYDLNKKVNCQYLEARASNKLLKKIEKIVKLRKLIKKEKPDAIIAFEYFINMQVIVASLGIKRKLVISERNDPASVGNNKKRLRNFLYGFANTLVCQTKGAKEYFPKKIQKKTVVIPNPISENLPKPWNGERKKEIVNFCRLEKQKNLPLLIDAFEKIHKEYPDYTLVIYGEGKEREYLTDYINKIEMSKYITLAHAVKDIHQRVLKSTMYVSSSNYEGLSNSMLEAMAIGLPTIVTDCPCGGAKMMIENDVNGILVPVKDVTAMYKAIKKVIENPNFAEEISKNAVKINQQLEQSKICDMWINIIK